MTNEIMFPTLTRSAVVVPRPECSILEVRGADRTDLLQRLTTNDLSSLSPGTSNATVLTTVKGRVLELFTLLAFDDHLLMLLSTDHAPAVIDHLNRYTITEDFMVRDISSFHSVFAILVDDAMSLADFAHGAEALTGQQSHAHVSVTIGDRPCTLACGVFFRGGGLTMIAHREDDERIHSMLASEGILSGSRDELERMRITNGIPGWGNELNERYNPLEVGAESAVSYTKGCYIGQEVIARLHSQNKVQRELASITWEQHINEKLPLGIVAEGKQIGELTSAVEQQHHHNMVGLGVIRREFIEEGKKVVINTAAASITATLHLLTDQRK